MAPETRDSLPDAHSLMGAVRQSILEQRSDYERILLPELGLGEQIEVDSMRMNVDGSLYATRPGSAWLFTPVSLDRWLHTPLRSMLSALGNTWILLDRDRVDDDVLRQLQPPTPPSLEKAIAALRWRVADYEGREGGRMTREEFLGEVAGQPWIRFNHNLTDETADLEAWRGTRLLSGWTVSIRDHFRFRLPWKRPNAPCTAPDWRAKPDLRPFETVVTLFLLDDPYELLRLFIREEHDFDPDLLGPLTVWKDLPDMLEEFSDDHDRDLADLRRAVAQRLDADLASTSEVLGRWFRDIAREGCTEFPTLGAIHRVPLPDVRIPRPVPLARDVPGPDCVASPGVVHAATALPPHTWMRSAKPRRRS